jgi:septum formation protein
MTLLEKRIYLASRSPRRRDLLKQIGVSFEVLMLRSQPPSRADVDETPLPGETPLEHTQRLCRVKADAGWARLLERHLPRFPVLAADTIVTLDGVIIGKPASVADAATILARLSGREHQVCTSVAVCFDQRTEWRSAFTTVVFRVLLEKEIRAYCASAEPMDKAGAYAIQGRAASFISRIEGSYSGVMGLPLYETAELLRLFGLPIL